MSTGLGIAMIVAAMGIAYVIQEIIIPRHRK